MATVKQALVRPVEISASNNTATVTWTGGGGGGPTAVNVPVGMYSSYYDVLDAFNTLIVALYAGLSATMDSNHKTVVAASSGTVAVSFTDVDFGRLLGYRANISAAASTTATDTPLNCWIPTVYTMDDQRFHVQQDQVFKGSRSVIGQLSGVQLTTGQYERILRWDAQPATNVFIEAAQTQYDWSGTTYYPQAERCFEQIMIDARTAKLSETTSNNLNPKGFYYIHDWTGYTAGSHPTDLGSGGIKFDLGAGTVSPDTFVFCTPDPQGPPLPEHLDKTAKNYYSVQAGVLTATAPTWNKP
jgi:hypothetical protein